MSKTLQFRRGSTTLINTFAGSDGELFVDTSKSTVVVMDGATLGGTPLATESFVTAALLRLSTTSVPGTVKIDGTSITISSGTISVPVATSGQIGIARTDGTSIIVNAGVVQLNPVQPNSFAVSGSVVMSSPFAFRNKLINGNLLFWQRGTTTSTNNSYLADRWVGTNITDQRQSSDVPNSSFPYSLEWSNSGLSYPLVAQRIPALEAASCVSSAMTISFWAKNLAGASNLYVELAYPITADTFTSTMVNVTGGTVGIGGGPTSSWTYYTYTWNTSVMAAGFANGLECRIVRDVASTSTTRIAGIQLEHGPVATPFERAPLYLQQALCQRYFQRFPDAAESANILLLWTVTGNRAALPMLPVAMRANPSVTHFSTGGTGGQATEFSAGTVLTVSGINGSSGERISSRTGGGYLQFSTTPANPVLHIARYDAEL